MALVVFDPTRLLLIYGGVALLTAILVIGAIVLIVVYGRKRD
jgi:hypothetical protein